MEGSRSVLSYKARQGQKKKSAVGKVIEHWEDEGGYNYISLHPCMYIKIKTGKTTTRMWRDGAAMKNSLFFLENLSAVPPTPGNLLLLWPLQAPVLPWHTSHKPMCLHINK